MVYLLDSDQFRSEPHIDPLGHCKAPHWRFAKYMTYIWRNDLYGWYTLKTDDLKVLYSTIPNRIQAAIRTNGGVTKCEMVCQIFTRNEISCKINCRPPDKSAYSKIIFFISHPKQ